MTDTTEIKHIRESRTIADDELAVSNCRQVRMMRLSEFLSQKKFGERYGISGSCIGAIERNPESVTVMVYNALALCLKWPAYQSGRKLQDGHSSPCEEQISPPDPLLDRRGVMKSESNVIEQKREALTFMDELLSVSPDEGFDAWFDSIDAKVKSETIRLSDFLDMTPKQVTVLALQVFTSRWKGAPNGR